MDSTKYGDLTKWTPAFYENFKPIPFVEIRQNPEARFCYNPNHHLSKDGERSSLKYDGRFVGWELRRSGDWSSKKGGSKAHDILRMGVGISNLGRAYFSMNIYSTEKKNNHYKLHKILRFTYPELIQNAYDTKKYPVIDHWDGDTLNNSLKNLRGVTYSLNSQNKTLISQDGSSKYYGVSKKKILSSSKAKPYSAKCVISDKKCLSRFFYIEEEAAAQYDLWAVEKFYIKDNLVPKLNFPEKLEQYVYEIQNKGQLELPL